MNWEGKSNESPPPGECVGASRPCWLRLATEITEITEVIEPSVITEALCRGEPFEHYSMATEPADCHPVCFSGWKEFAGWRSACAKGPIGPHSCLSCARWLCSEPRIRAFPSAALRFCCGVGKPWIDARGRNHFANSAVDSPTIRVILSPAASMLRCG